MGISPISAKKSRADCEKKSPTGKKCIHGLCLIKKFSGLSNKVKRAIHQQAFSSCFLLDDIAFLAFSFCRLSLMHLVEILFRCVSLGRIINCLGNKKKSKKYHATLNNPSSENSLAFRNLKVFDVITSQVLLIFLLFLAVEFDSEVKVSCLLGR